MQRLKLGISCVKPIAGRRAVFAEGWSVIPERGPRFLSWILDVDRGVASLAHAVRHPSDSPNRKTARNLCLERMRAGIRMRLPSETVIRRMAWIGAEAEGLPPPPVYSLGQNCDSFFDDLDLEAFARCADAFFLEGFRMPSSSLDGPEPCHAPHCGAPDMDIMEALMESESFHCRMR